MANQSIESSLHPVRGALISRAEIIPIKPDAGNADEGKGSCANEHDTIRQAIPIWLLGLNFKTC